MTELRIVLDLRTNTLPHWYRNTITESVPHSLHNLTWYATANNNNNDDDDKNK